MIKQRCAQYRIDEKSVLHYCEYYDPKKKKQNLLMLHAQGTDSTSFRNVVRALARHFHLYLVDYYGHGKSSHNAEKYDLDREETLWLISVIGFSDSVRAVVENAAKEAGFQKIRWVQAGGVITTHGGPAAFGMAGFSRKK